MNNRKKSRELDRKKQEFVIGYKEKTSKYNLSDDNLKCFIDNLHPKTERKRISSRYDSSLTD